MVDCQINKVFLLVFLLCSMGVNARQVSVSSASAINNGSWQAGDTLVMQDGVWTDQKISITATGTVSEPVVLRAATAGGVHLTGSSQLTVNGVWVEVNGLVFEGTYTGKSHAITFAKGTRNCRLTETVIRGYSPADPTVDTKWVSLYGQGHQVDHCLFENKTNMGTLLVVWLETDIVPAHRIDNNIFGYRTANMDENGKELNGQEIIRIGDSSTSMQQAACIVEDNWFKQCDGEIEVVSNKSCGNTYRHNTFFACAGMLTLRHGNGCIVEENCFYGTQKAGSGGVRVIGEDHVVRGNYMQDLAGNNYRAAICLVRGKANSALNEYFQVKNATIEGNIMVNCKEAFSVNYHSAIGCTLPPVNTRIADNIIYNDADHKSNYCVSIADTTAVEIEWEDNRANQGKYKNTTASALGILSCTAADAECPLLLKTEEEVGPRWMHRDTSTENNYAEIPFAAKQHDIQMGIFTLCIRNGQKFLKITR